MKKLILKLFIFLSFMNFYSASIACSFLGTSEGQDFVDHYQSISKSYQKLSRNLFIEEHYNSYELDGMEIALTVVKDNLETLKKRLPRLSNAQNCQNELRDVNSSIDMIEYSLSFELEKKLKELKESTGRPKFRDDDNIKDNNPSMKPSSNSINNDSNSSNFSRDR